MIFIMDFKNILSRSWIIPSFFWAFCSAGKLPSDDDRLVTGKCFQSNLYPFFKEEVRGKLSVAEFLGLFCKNYIANVWDFQKQINKIKKENEVITLSDEIKECLQLKSKSRLFYKYKGFGIQLKNEEAVKALLFKELPFNDNGTELPSEQGSQKSEYNADYEELPKPHTSESEPSKVASSDHSERQRYKKQFDDVLVLKEIEHHGDDRDDTDESQDFTEFYWLTTGLCKSPEFVSFDELEDDQDKSKTLNCSVSCVNTFIHNIQKQLIKEVDTLKFKKGFSMESSLPSLGMFTAAISDSKISNFQDITKLLKPWLQEYDVTYSHLAQQYNTINIIYMDAELKNIYRHYESCIQWECAMKTSQDIPISEFLKPDGYKNIKYSIFRAFAEEAKYRSSPEDDAKPNQWLTSRQEVGGTSSAATKPE